MSRRILAVIMAGGKGERFWPLSTPDRPKQFVDLTGGGTLIQQTVARVAQVLPHTEIYVVTGQGQLAMARAQLPEIPAENFIAEPVGRDTAPCIGLAAVWLEKVDPQAIMLVLPADHYVPDAAKFGQVLLAAAEQAENTRGLVTIGIRPDRPETGYGYLEVGARFPAAEAAPIFRVKRFVEKPDLARAQEYLAHGGYLWNAGIFAWRVSSIRAEIARHVPELHAGLEELAAAPDHRKLAERIPTIFPRLPRISIDHGVMERSYQVFVIPGHFQWDDLGTWAAVARLGQADSQGNVVRGPAVLEDCRNLLVESSGRLIALLGVSDLVVVEAGERVLIAPKDRVQEVRRLAARTESPKAGA
jgi:mannose-1-phosphate guanylyltransferase